MPQTRSHPISAMWARSAGDCSRVPESSGKNRSLSYSLIFETHVAASRRVASVRREIRQLVDPDSNDWCCAPAGDRQPQVKPSWLCSFATRETHSRRHFPFSLRIEIHRDWSPIAIVVSENISHVHLAWFRGLRYECTS